MSEHGGREVIVKVNCPVDPGIAPLVKAMSAFPVVLTVDSCEGYEGRAHVAFDVFGSTECELVEFVQRLARGLDIGATVSLEWPTGGERPLAYIRVPREDIDNLAVSVARLAPVPPA
jgi:hypothetical protein